MVKSKNKYQHKLIVLISTLDYLNKNLKIYTQKDILYYLNSNYKRNGQAPIKIKTLQNYLYKLGKELKLTINYYKHLGKNLGTKIYYKLKYTKYDCYKKINNHFKDKKIINHINLLTKDTEKKNNKINSNDKKGECIYNIVTKDKRRNSEIEDFQISSYISKCNFKIKIFPYLSKLNVTKEDKIKIIKTIKYIENDLLKEFNGKNYKRKFSTNTENKQIKLKKVLNNLKLEFENAGYNKLQIEYHIENIFNKYKNKAHFIIENEKYEDLNQIIKKLKNKIEINKNENKEEIQTIKRNSFSILFEQFKNKTNNTDLTNILKTYLKELNDISYKDIFIGGKHFEKISELIKNVKLYQEYSLINNNVKTSIWKN